MGFVVFLVFLAVPLIEIALFVRIGGWIGLWPTIGIVALTAVIGTTLLRIQGFNTLARARQSLDEGQLPVNEVFDGFCLVLAGALLLTPGFFTDTVGFLLFLPPLRGSLRRVLGLYLAKHATVHVHTEGFGPHRSRPDGGRTDVIDGEFEDVTGRDDGPPRRG